MTAKVSFLAADGQPCEMQIGKHLYRQAAEKGISPRHLINRMAAEASADRGGVATKHGDAFTQAIVSANMVRDAKLGEQALTFGQIMAAEFNSSTTRAPSGDDTTTAAQVLYPQVILEAIIKNANVQDNGFMAQYGQLMADTQNVTSARIDQPIINMKSSEDAPSGRGAQLSAPPTMMEITVGDTQYRIPTEGIGLMVSKEALEATTLDLMSLAINRQALGQRIRMAKSQIAGIINGDADRGQRPLPVRKFSEFDATAGGKFTKRGYLKMLRENRFEYTRTQGLLTFDTACDMDDILTDSIKVGPDAHKIVAPFNAIDLNVPNPHYLDLENDILGSANRIVLIDPTAAMRRIINVSAEYEGIEEFIMRKAVGFRADHGEIATRLFDEAFLVVDLNV